MAYLDLNPLRVGIVSRPEGYHWIPIGNHIQTNNLDNFLSTNFGLKVLNDQSKKECIRRYRRYVYEGGEISRLEKIQAELLMISFLQKRANKTLKSAASVGSETAPAIFQIPGSSVQRNLYLKITGD